MLKPCFANIDVTLWTIPTLSAPSRENFPVSIALEIEQKNGRPVDHEIQEIRVRGKIVRQTFTYIQCPNGRLEFLPCSVPNGC